MQRQNFMDQAPLEEAERRLGLKLRPGDQPLPLLNEERDIQSRVIEDIEERRRVGIGRYGTALQPFNGRDALRDAYEEAIDLTMYLKQTLVERGEELVSLSVETYQDEASSTAIYPGQGSFMGLAYTALGLVGEAGEVANKVKKLLRGDKDLTPEVRNQIANEIGDVMWYCAQAATELGLELEEIARGNLNKLAARKDAGLIKGSGDTR